MADISKITALDGTTYNIKDAVARPRGVEYIRGTWSTASNVWTGVTTDTALYNGKQIVLYMPYAGNGSNVTLNLTLSGGSTTGAKNVYFESTTRFTTHKGAYSQLPLIYLESHNINGTNYTGWWYIANRDTTNVYQLGNTYNTYKAKATIYRYAILFTVDAEYVVPSTSVNNSTATNKALTTESFDPNGEIWYWNSTTTVTAGSKLPDWNACMSHFTNGTVNFSYAFNTGTTLTANKAVYLVCVPQNDGKVKLHSSPISQTLPTTEDGLIYKFLGYAYNTSNITLMQHKPCYWYKDGGVREWSNTPSYWQYNSTTDSIDLIFPS